MTRLEVVPYDANWPLAFAMERERIVSALGPVALRVEHHGSTAVPGLAAKPIIDIQISVAELHPLERYVGPLARIGYVHVPHADDAVCPYLHRPATWPHTHHIHVVRAGGIEELRTLAFRDLLRDRAELARDYENLKRGLIVAGDAQRFETQQAYADAKGPFVLEMTERALAQGYPRNQPG